MGRTAEPARHERVISLTPARSRAGATAGGLDRCRDPSMVEHAFTAGKITTG
jgi:hypothetical protein